MAWSFSTIKTRVSSLLQDPSATIFSADTDGEMELEITDSLREICRWLPYIASEPDVLKIENRSGTATSDTSGALVDATNAQFLSTDVGKVVYNVDDKDWGIVTAYVSASQLTLNKDLFPDGDETYQMYNKGCTEINQINIEDIVDRYTVEDGDRLEYPIGTRRNVSALEGDILTVGIEPSEINDTTQVDDASPYEDVHLYTRKKHFISELTDLLGAVDNASGYAAGTTTMDVNVLQSSGTMKVGQLFTVAGTTGIYRVTTAASISSNKAEITFYPGLENAVDDTDVVTFKQSTLTPTLEPLFCRYVAAKLAINKPSVIIPESRSKANPLMTEGTFTINESNKGGPGTAGDYLNYAKQQIALVEQQRFYGQIGAEMLRRVERELSELAISMPHEILPRT